MAKMDSQPVESSQKPQGVRRVQKKTIIKKKHTTLYVILAIVVVIAIAAVAFFLLRKGPKGPQQGTGTTEGSLAATVNGEPITTADIDQAFDRLPAMYKQVVTRPQVLEQLIDEKLLLNEAKAQGIKLPPGEIDRQVAQLKTDNKLTQEQFDKALAAQNLTEADFKALFEKRLIIQTLFNQSVLNNIQISDADAQKYYDQNKDQFFQAEQIRASHILVNSSSLAQDIRSQLMNGANFSELAVKYSIDPSAKYNEGDLGFFSHGQMVPAFEDAAFNLSVGDISQVVQTQFGYHIILVTAKKGAQQVPFDQVKQSIMDGLKNQQGQAVFGQWIAQLKAKAQVAYYGDFKNTTQSIPTSQQTTQPSQQDQQPQDTQPAPQDTQPTQAPPPQPTTPPPASPSPPSSADSSLASCLASKGVILYGAYWNKETQDQLTLFGNDQGNLAYVECGVQGDYTAMMKKCVDAGIQGFPTWKIGDKLVTGSQTLDKLKSFAGC